jgi:hypothetical protein
VFLAAAISANYAPSGNDSSIIVNADLTVNGANGTSVPASVVINELMADNGAAVESFYGTYPDWIELYNTGNQTVDLSGMYLSDRLSQPTWRFPLDTTLDPGGFLLVWADGDSDLGYLFTDFKLTANGEAVALFASDGTTIIDSVRYEKQIQDVSFGRSPDGSTGWKYLTKPTAGEANLENVRSQTSADWPVWVVIGVALVACVLFIVKDRLQARRKP